MTLLGIVVLVGAIINAVWIADITFITYKLKRLQYTTAMKEIHRIGELIHDRKKCIITMGIMDICLLAVSLLIIF